MLTDFIVRPTKDKRGVRIRVKGSAGLLDITGDAEEVVAMLEQAAEDGVLRFTCKVPADEVRFALRHLPKLHRTVSF